MTWQPIATAPETDKDNRVDLWVTQNIRLPDCWRTEDGQWVHYHGGASIPVPRGSITHWAPIPLPPGPIPVAVEYGKIDRLSWTQHDAVHSGVSDIIKRLEASPCGCRASILASVTMTLVMMASDPVGTWEDFAACVGEAIDAHLDAVAHAH